MSISLDELEREFPDALAGTLQTGDTPPRYTLNDAGRAAQFVDTLGIQRYRQTLDLPQVRQFSEFFSAS